MSTRRDLVPACLAGSIGLGVVFVRVPLPVDETRYLEVFREHLAGSPLLLHLLGEPYAEKPPLLFWLARALTWAGAAPEIALRCLPALASGLTVFCVARIGRRANLELAGWLQAALLLPFLAGQFLLFDPLLACAIWGALLAWIQRRDFLCGLASSAALLTKGPVAFLFLVPLMWSTIPLRGPAPHTLRRAAALLALALVPLAVWALGAAYLGGPEFASALLWDRWAGRVVHSFAHEQPLWFYAPVALVGSLPGTLTLFRSASTRPDWARRMGWTLVFLLLAFSAISAKQPHYLVPAAPALVLLVAREVEHSEAGLRRLRLGVRIQLFLFAAALVAGILYADELRRSTGPFGIAFLEGGSWKAPLALAAVALAAGLALSVFLRHSARALLASSALCLGLCSLALHGIGGRLLYPHALAAFLDAAPDSPVAFLGNRHHGIYEILAAPRHPQRLADRAALLAWAVDHPDGLILVDCDDLGGPVPAGLEAAASDVVHRSPVLVLRAMS